MFDYRESAEFLKKCQVIDGTDIEGTVCPWELGAGQPPREDLHDTLEALYIWTRQENIYSCAENVRLAIQYTKRKFQWYKEEEEPLKSYDSAYYLLALHSYLKFENNSDLKGIRDYAKTYLIEYFKSNPMHHLREYSNPYWKGGILAIVLDDEGENTKFLASWLGEDTLLQNPSDEGYHEGRGYQYPHDFVSEFGTKLMLMNLVVPEKVPKKLDESIPNGFVSRKIDEVSFNSSVLYGLCTLNSNTSSDFSKATKSIEKIKEEIESRIVGGGLKRGKYFPIRESWPTFFYYFSRLLCERKLIF
ncbi:MAG: hypothetical protein ACP5OC_06440 [Thermoplasmata archaeon]